MTATTVTDLRDLLADVDSATKLMQRSAAVPDEVASVIDSVGAALDASAVHQEADPYLTATLWKSAYLAEKALRHDPAQRRRDVRIALEQFRQALRDITEDRLYTADSPIGEIVAATVQALNVPQKDVASLLGVSVRQLQRWLSEAGSEPSADDAGRIRAVGQIVNQLRHTFTGPGVLAWFRREHPALGQAPIDVLEDPLRYPEILRLARSARAMAA